jgi:dihydrolipoamide dehydrogenase
VVAADIRADGVSLTLEPAGGGEKEKLDADVALVAVGRRPRTEVLLRHSAATQCAV